MAETRLTEQQQAVVENRGGTLLVSAAAGSGKTKVLVDRVLRRIVEEGRNIHEFLIITFTNAAAAELRVKISEALTDALAKQPGSRHLTRQLSLLHLSQISTVHAFCGTLIRQYGYLLEIPADARLMEDAEREALLTRQLDLVLEDAYGSAEPAFLQLADTLGAGRTDEALRDTVLSMYDKLQSQCSPGQWLALQRRRLRLDEDGDLAETDWGRILTGAARQQLLWLIERYRWAVSAMEGDALLEKQYLPAYREQLSCLENMLPALDGPWDAIAPSLTLEYPRIAVRGYPDQHLLDDIKAVKSDGKALLEDLRRIFSRSEETLRAEQNAMAPALEALLDLTERLDLRFSAEKRRKNLMDFSDQEHLAIRLLTRNGQPSQVAREVSERYAEIMVDEYQDSNQVQETIFTAISQGRDENRFLVGDVKQSIYGFRQAEPELFLDKYKKFPPAAQAKPGEPRRLVLSKNFRSRPEILEAVNHTFQTVMSETVGDLEYGPDERLYPGLEGYPDAAGPHVELHVLALEPLPPESGESKYRREADWAARRIVELLEAGTPVRDGEGTRPVRPGDIAVLFRTRDAISHYSRALQQAGVPVAAESGGDLFETPEVAVLVNLLRVLSNPHQDVPLLSVLCSPLFRFSNEQLAAIRAGSSRARFYDAMTECPEPWCAGALHRLEALRRQAGTVSADRLVWNLLHETGLLAAYSAMEGGADRRENLLAIYRLALDGASGGFLYLYQLLRLLDRAAQSGVSASTRASDGVILTTIHRSKGLEYPVVLLADLSRRFNFRELSDSVLFDGTLGLASKITDTALRVRYPGLCWEALRQKKRQLLRSEELRILYVAMTRPKDYLIMTYAGEYAETALSRLRAGAGQPAAAWAASEASCLGDWVLLSALNRVEAGALFEICGRPACDLAVSPLPWRITYTNVSRTEVPAYHAPAETAEVQAFPSPEQMAAHLRWRDVHSAAAATPSKVTATQLKGRDKDTEAAEGAVGAARLPQLHRPEFVLEQTGLSPTERGTAVHLFLQYVDFTACQTAEGVRAEKLRLEDGAFMTHAQLEAVDPSSIVTLFTSALGRRMLGAEELIREFKFSLLDDAARYYPEAEGEQLLLQGVVDAAWMEPDGLRVVDFKTDRVTEATLMDRAERYRGQLTAYRYALERIFQRPVREMYLYFLTVGREVAL